MNICQKLYLTRFSFPWQDRAIYRFVEKAKPTRIVEIGIQSGRRTENLLRLAGSQVCYPDYIEYCCVDPFEDRCEADGPGLSFRKAYKKNNRHGIQLRCFSFHEGYSMIRVAKYMQSPDLLIIAMPDTHWISEQLHLFSSFLSESTAIFVGSRPDSEHVYTFEQWYRTAFLSNYADRFPQQKKAA